MNTKLNNSPFPWMNTEPVTSVTHGIEDDFFAHLDDITKHHLLVIMARISEKSFRRGFHQAIESDHPVIVEPLDWRHLSSLDEATSPHGRCSMPSIDRLGTEHGCELSAVGIQPLYPYPEEERCSICVNNCANGYTMVDAFGDGPVPVCASCMKEVA